MFKQTTMNLCAAGSVLIALPGLVCAETIGVFFNSPTNGQISFAANDVKAALEARSYTVEFLNVAQLNTNYANKKVVIGLSSDSAITSVLTAQGGAAPGALGEQAYALRTTTTGGLSYWALGGDTNGAMYGGLQIAENISFNGFSGSYNSQESPFLTYRGMKLNLPLDKRIPTYVGGWSSHSAQEAIPHVWDMTFWKTLIDQQARSRYNLLSVWVHHPFPALVSVPDYPNASLPNIQRYDGSIINLNHSQRVAFWRAVMQYAHDRGMKFYFFNWNIYVDYASTQYPALTTSPTNPTTIDYFYKSMRALLETYPELDGFGISTGDGMSGTAAENTQWSWDAMGKAVYDYLTNNPARLFNLIHRGIGTDPSQCNITYGPLLGVTNAAFNMSAKYAMAHMYSTPAPRWTGDIDSCFNLGLKTFITVRNDDYFYINWGDPKFVRDFMTGIPRKDTTVRGMYIGIDGYNPSRTYFYKNASLNGQLEVERRWYMEMLWGRLSYNTNTSDVVLKSLLAQRYALAAAPATNLFNAWSLASRSLPKVTELVMKNWQLDFHWYPEGCWSDPGRGSGFRTISDVTGATGGFAGQDVANGSSLCNIANSAAGTCSGKKSSYQLADEMQADATNALALISTVASGGNVDLDVAIKNVKQMAYLSRYYAHKIRGATYNKAGNTDSARIEMGKAYCSWISYSQLMDEMYYGDSFRNLQVQPDWKFADAAVLKEYTDLGGVGYPSCDDLFTLTTAGANGSVTLNPSGGVYSTGTVVTLTASPNFGYAFANWSGDLSGSVSPATLTMNTNKSVTASFVVSAADVAPWLETFSLNDGTKSHGAPSSWMATRATGTFQVSGNRFMINGASGEGVVETAPINIPGGSVKVSLQVQAAGGVDSGDYVRFYKIVDGGAKVLIAQQAGVFSGTNTMVGTNIVGSNLKLRIEASVTASDEYYFMDNLKVEYEAALPMFTLTTSGTNGSIALNPPGGVYTTGTVVAVTANASIGYAFSHWSGDLGGSVNPTNLTMNGNKNISANFVPVPTYTLTTSGTNGSISLNPPGGVYNTGTVVTVTANANSGYAFANWSGDLTGSVNPTNITMTGNKSVTANFVSLPTYTITATAGANGAITPSNSVVVNQNANQTFTMLPNSDYEVDVVTVDGASQGSANSYTFTNVLTNHTISVTFKVSSGGVGLLGSWVQGTTHAKEAGNNRALVVMLYGEGSGNISASSVTYGGQPMTKVVEKAFLNSSYSYSGAFVLNEAGVAAATSGTIAVTWSTAPSAGSDMTSAFYSGVNQTTLTGASASNGLVGLTITTTALANNAGDMVLVGGTAGTAGTYTINNGFTRGIPETTASFGDITSAYKLGTGANETPSLTMSASMRQTIVVFVLRKSAAAPVQYTLTTNAVNGSITLNPTGGVYTGGTVVAVTANPNSGYAFSGWSGDLSGSVSPTNITMNANKSVTANFSVQSISFQPPVLQGGQLKLEWVGGGTLQTATNVLGSWSDIPGAVSPYLAPATNSAQFFRVKQ